jgi:dGTPase
MTRSGTELKPADQYERFWDSEKGKSDREADQRDEGARDRDRVLYTSALRRLAGVTQVVPASEGFVFHNRLTHTTEVSQIARRLSQHLLADQPDVAQEIGGLDPEVAEAAALAHDIGHPPFGHVAEIELDRCITGEFGIDDGFEGNAQSFRVVTQLAQRHEDFQGLNLTRATLNAVLKYPWRRDRGHPKRSRKWGAFLSEIEEFAWTRRPFVADGRDAGRRSIEAEVMDWADDVAYAVHDLEDFYRGGVVPLDRLLRLEPIDIQEFWAGATQRWQRDGLYDSWDKDELHSILIDLLNDVRDPLLMRPFNGSVAQRAALRSLTARYVRRYVMRPDPDSGQLGPRLRVPISPDGSFLMRNERAEKEVALLKEFIWQYVILNPALASQQEGQRRLVKFLFHAYRRAAKRREALLPRGFRDQMPDLLRRVGDERIAFARIAADVICSMTEFQALSMYQRLSGQAIGSVLDAIIR